MSYRSDTEVLVSLALRLKGFGEVRTIASVHELSVSTTEAVLAKMVASNKCVMREIQGLEKFVLTPTGREQGEESLARELEEVGARDAVEPASGVVQRAFQVAGEPGRGRESAERVWLGLGLTWAKLV